METKDFITSRICGSTVFEDAWIWYCDECQQHGTAFSAKEAHHMAEAHSLWNSYVVRNEEAAPSLADEAWDKWFEENNLNYVDATDDERELYQGLWDNDGCYMYIISEGRNITYNFGDDYEDLTPNAVTDIETMIKIQKIMGLE